MRRKPVIPQQPILNRPLANLASPSGPIPPSTPTTQGDVIEPFLVGGGQTYYLTNWTLEPALPPELGGVQLIAHQFVPKGRAAWIKRIMVAPCAPPAIVDPWRGWAGNAQLFQPLPNPRATAQRAGAQAGLWETPLAWEGYFQPSEAAPIIPKWRWHLTLLPGSLQIFRQQQNAPPFDVLNPASWYLVPDIAVPNWVYRGGIPGRGINGDISPQRIQHTPTNALPCHIFIPENNTVCLWASWEQAPFTPLAFDENGVKEIFPIPFPGNPAEQVIWPLLPSVGSLVGYMQAASRTASEKNAAFGWGG